MSLILEALNRSSRDRNVEEGAPLHAKGHVEQSQTPRSALAWLPWLALLLALLAIGGLLFERFAGEALQDTQIKVPLENRARDVLADSANMKPIAALAQRPALAANSAPTDVSMQDSGSTNVTDPAVAALYSSATNRSVAVQTPVPAIIAEPPLKEVPIDLEEVLTRTQEALKTQRLPEHSAPFLSTLSQQAKDDVPTMLYSAHDYSSKPGQSSVVINGKSLGQGDSVAGGVKLDEILPDSIVLSHTGNRFRLRALNSWVNL